MGSIRSEEYMIVSVELDGRAMRGVTSTMTASVFALTAALFSACLAVLCFTLFPIS